MAVTAGANLGGNETETDLLDQNVLASGRT